MKAIAKTVQIATQFDDKWEINPVRYKVQLKKI